LLPSEAGATRSRHANRAKTAFVHCAPQRCRQGAAGNGAAGKRLIERAPSRYRPAQQTLAVPSGNPTKTGQACSMHGCFITFCSPHPRPPVVAKLLSSAQARSASGSVSRRHRHWSAAAAPACAVNEPSTNVPEQGWPLASPTTRLFRRPSVFHVISGRSLDRPCRRGLGALHSPVF
jgi:hypothetical protein